VKKGWENLGAKLPEVIEKGVDFDTFLIILTHFPSHEQNPLSSRIKSAIFHQNSLLYSICLQMFVLRNAMDQSGL